MMGLYLPGGPLNKTKVKQTPTKIVGDVSKTPGTQIPPAKPLTTKPQRMALNKTPRKGSVSGQDRNPYEKKQDGGVMRPSDPRNRPVTAGDRIHNAISDVGTGVATWGTSFRPPTDAEKKLGRGTWADRAKLLAGAATQGLTNEMIAGGIGKIAGKFIPKSVTKIVPKSETIDVGSKMYNRQNVTNEITTNAPMEKDLVEYLNGLPHDEFAAYAKKRAGYVNLGRYFTVTPSGLKKGGLLSTKKAKTILHDKEVRGHPLTDKQRRYFGYLSNKK
jgi:hypothetical protein